MAVKGVRTFALVDTGADTSAISLSLVGELGLEDQITPPAPNEPSELDTCVKDVRVQRRGTVTVELECETQRGHRVFDTKLEVIDSEDPVVIGLDLFARIGISVGGLPLKWPKSAVGEADFVAAAIADEALREKPKVFELLDDHKEAQKVKKALADLLAENDKLDWSKPACSAFPDATMHLPLAVDGSWRHQYPLPAAALPAARKQIHEWLERGTIGESSQNGDFNSALLAASKKDLAGKPTKWRLCVDMRHLNSQLLDTFSHAKERTPHLHEALAKTAGFKLATCLDLKAAYENLPIAVEDRDKTCFTFEGKRYHFKRWCYGITSATQKFQKVMEQVLQGLEANVTIYLDDLCVFTKTDSIEEHIETVRAVLKRLNEHGLKLNLDKCEFAKTTILLLGHQISGEGRSLDPLKLQDMLEWHQPSTGKGIQSLLGFTGFISEYLPDYQKLVAPLQALRKTKRFDLDDAQHASAKEAFLNLQQAMKSAPFLHTPDPDLPFMVACDASQTALGAMIWQVEPSGKKRYIAFASTTLKGAQKNYGASKRELLGICFALQSFYVHLAGRKFKLYCDNKSLSALFTARRLSYTLAGWLDTLLAFDFEVEHIKGLDNHLPDALSRMYEGLEDEGPVNLSPSLKKRESAKFSAWAAEQEELDDDFEIAAAMGDEKGSQEVVDVEQERLRRGIPLDELMNFPDRELAEFIRERHLKVVPPVEEREGILHREHSQAHWGAEPLFKRIWRQNMYWPGLKRDCVKRVAHCAACLRYNTGRHGFHPIQTLRADGVWEHVACDSLGPLPVSKSQNVYVVILVDVKSRFLVTRAVPNLQMSTISRALYEVFSIFGPPGALQHDNGTEYVNELVEQLLAHAGVNDRRISSRNPRANGLAETFVKMVKNCLKKVLNGEFDDWDAALPGITAAINLHDNGRTRTAPFTLFFNRTSNNWSDYVLEKVLGDRAKLLDEALNEIAPPAFSDNERLARTNREDARLIHSAVDEATAKRQQTINMRMDTKRNSIVRTYPRGATVFKINEEANSKLEPLWVGPFYVRRQSKRNRTYYLRDADGAPLERGVPVSKLKWVSDDTVALYDNNGESIDAAAERGIVKAILKTKRDVALGVTKYLVAWKDPREANMWLRKEDFDDPSALVEFWRKNRPAHGKNKKSREHQNQASPPAPKKQKVEQKNPPGDELLGKTLAVPARWFNDDYARRIYRDKWKKATETFTVQSVIAKDGKWLTYRIVSPNDPTDNHRMRSDAVKKYLA